MDEEREKRAIRRIDEAFVKAEAALRRMKSQPAPLHAAGDAELKARHEHLRTQTSEALTQLDDLIDGLKK